MALSIRNQLAGRVSDVSVGDVMSTVKVQVGQDEITAAVAAGAARPLNLTPGTAVHVLIASADVSLSTGPVEQLTIRNKLPGTLTRILPGPVITSVEITLRGGEVVTAVILREIVEELKLREGLPVAALVRSTEVNLSEP